MKLNKPIGMESIDTNSCHKSKLNKPIGIAIKLIVMHSSYIASYIAIVMMLIISNIITKLAAVTPVYKVNNHTSILSILTASIYLQNQQV